MESELIERGGLRILHVGSTGPALRSGQDAIPLMERAFEHHASVVAVPVARLAPDFFRLRTGVAGDIVQKFAAYRMGFAVLGDISAQVANSDALRDFVRECNRGTAIVFADDIDALAARLGRH